MKALKTILIILLVLIVALLVVGLFLPNSVHLERSNLMKCSDQIVFDQVNDLHHWKRWSPFAESDTSMITYYAEKTSGTGGMMMWKGKRDTGTMTIVESIPNSYIKTKLDFIDRGGAEAEWKFSEGDEGTHVTWTFDVRELGYPFGRYFGLFMPSMMENLYDKGLTNLKNLCENLPEIKGLEVKNIEAQKALIITDSASMEMIALKMSQMYGEIVGFMNVKDIEMAGAPFTVWHSWDPSNKFVFDAGIPFAGEVDGDGRIIVGEIPAGKVITAPHYGNYDKTADLHHAIQKYLEVIISNILVSHGKCISLIP